MSARALRRGPARPAPERRPHVVHVLPHAWPLGGAERSVLDLLAAPELAHLDQRVLFLQGGRLGPFPRDRVLAHRGRPGPNRAAAVAAVLRARPPILHGWLLRGNLFAALVGAILPRTRALSSERNLGHNLTRLTRPLERIVALGEQRCIVNSYAVAAAVAGRLPRRARRIEVIPPGVAAAENRGTTEESSCVMVGRLHPVKDHDSALRAWAELVRDRPGLTLTVVGDGPERQRLARLAGRLGLDGSVRMVGHRDPWPYLRGARVYLSSSRAEGFSRSMVEALTVGLPVVSTDVGGARELPPAAARLVRVGDHLAMAASLAGLLDDAGARELAGRAALMAAEAYAPAVCHARYRDLYASLGVVG